MNRQHNYQTHIQWTGNNGTGTSAYDAYARNYTLTAPNKIPLEASADTVFRGESDKYNPEEMLVAALSSCHMLWFLHLCADAGIQVMAYEDEAKGVLQEKEQGGGHFAEVSLNPHVHILDEAQIDQANKLHSEAHKKCFIANSCNFPIHIKPNCSLYVRTESEL